MTDNTDTAQKLLEEVLQKFNALNKKFTRIEDNLNMQIRDIKVNPETHKLQNKHKTL